MRFTVPRAGIEPARDIIPGDFKSVSDLDTRSASGAPCPQKSIDFHDLESAPTWTPGGPGGHTEPWGGASRGPVERGAS